jgi:hypothetical protein
MATTTANGSGAEILIEEGMLILFASASNTASAQAR